MRRRIIGLVGVLVVVLALAAVSIALLTRSEAPGDADLLATIGALETEVAERDIDLAATAEAILGGYAPPFTETWRVEAVRQYPARPQLRTGRPTGLYDDMEYTDHQAAGQFVVFELELTNIDTVARDSPVPADTFAVIDPEGRTYTADLDLSWKLRNAEHLGPDFDTYQPDTSGSEIVVFDLPTDVAPATLASKDGSWSVTLTGPNVQGTPVADPFVPETRDRTPSPDGAQAAASGGFCVPADWLVKPPGGHTAAGWGSRVGSQVSAVRTLGGGWLGRSPCSRWTGTGHRLAGTGQPIGKSL